MNTLIEILNDASATAGELARGAWHAWGTSWVSQRMRAARVTLALLLLLYAIYAYVGAAIASQYGITSNENIGFAAGFPSFVMLMVLLFGGPEFNAVILGSLFSRSRWIREYEPNARHPERDVARARLERPIWGMPMVLLGMYLNLLWTTCWILLWIPQVFSSWRITAILVSAILWVLNGMLGDDIHPVPIYRFWKKINFYLLLATIVLGGLISLVYKPGPRATITTSYHGATMPSKKINLSMATVSRTVKSVGEKLPVTFSTSSAVHYAVIFPTNVPKYMINVPAKAGQTLVIEEMSGQYVWRWPTNDGGTDERLVGVCGAGFTPGQMTGKDPNHPYIDNGSAGGAVFVLQKNGSNEQFYPVCQYRSFTVRYGDVFYLVTNTRQGSEYLNDGTLRFRVRLD